MGGPWDKVFHPTRQRVQKLLVHGRVLRPLRSRTRNAIGTVQFVQPRAIAQARGDKRRRRHISQVIPRLLQEQQFQHVAASATEGDDVAGERVYAKCTGPASPVHQSRCAEPCSRETAPAAIFSRCRKYLRHRRVRIRRNGPRDGNRTRHLRMPAGFQHDGGETDEAPRLRRQAAAARVIDQIAPASAYRRRIQRTTRASFDPR